MGGKARHLWQLTQLGLPVPDWFCLASSAFEAVLSPCFAELEDYLQQQQFKLAQDRVQQAFPGPALLQELSERLSTESFYAVRSSAAGEDGGRDSFAGQFDTYLYVPASEVVDKILMCWQSAFSERLHLYLEQRQLSLAALKMAVVVQKMVLSEAAGVMFMANPMGALTEVVINAGWGLGEGIVSDAVPADTYYYDRSRSQWRIESVIKDFAIVPVAALGGTEKLAVPVARQEQPALDTEQAQTLFELGERIQKAFANYQDIEWALDAEGQFWILQTRAITTLLPGEKTLFENSNVVESYPGMTRALTFSYIRGAYEILFRNSVIRLGVPRQLVFEQQSAFKNMLGYLQGRVYYNLSNWYLMFRLVPGTESYIRVWEEMMGITQAEPGPAPGIDWKRFAIPWAKMGTRLFWTFLRLEHHLSAFRSRFQAVSQRFWAQDHSQWNAHQLLREYDRLCSDLLYGWEITVLNDGYAFIFSALSKNLLTRAGFADPTALFNDLLCGEAGMESVEPVHSVLRLSALLRQSAALSAQVKVALDQEPIIEWEQIQSWQTDYPDFVTGLTQHIAKYGDRTFAELKLETYTLRDRPADLLRWVLDVSQTETQLSDMQQHERQIRAAAEQKLKQERRLNPLLKPVLSYVLTQARRCINYREASRLDRARSFGMVRQVFRCLGQELAQAKLILAADDVFDLSVEELSALVRGSGPSAPWQELIRYRQQQLQDWEEQSLAERILCQGPVAPHLLPLKDLPAMGSGQLRGTGCAPGEVIAEALVVRDPSQAREVQGKILVAEMTDPGWVFLMIQAAGLIVEKGSLLSHTAIIGRELGIPTIVGVSGAAQRIQSGDRIRMNGQTGLIEHLE